jgi:hypothetical protein
MAMQEPTSLVLTVLAGPPPHGYGIMRAVDELSGGGPPLRAGTLYAALGAMALVTALLLVGLVPDVRAGPALPRATGKIMT